MSTSPILDGFFQQHPARLYRKNVIIFDSGQLPQGLFFVVSGRVKIAISDSKGQESILFILGPSDPFPLAPYFLGEPQGSTYTALTDVEVIWRPRHEVDDFLNRNPEALREVLCTLLRAFYNRVTHLSLNKSQQRLVYRLVYLAGRFGELTNGWVEIDTTHQELANSINLTRESISLMLNRLQDDGVVQLHRNKIGINLDRADALIEDET